MEPYEHLIKANQFITDSLLNMYDPDNHEMEIKEEIREEVREKRQNEVD